MNTQAATTTSTRKTASAERDASAPVLTIRQQRELLRAPDKRTRLGRRDSALIAILLGTGARISEILALRVQDIERGKGGSLLLTMKTLKRRKKDKDGNKLPPPLRTVALLPPFTGSVNKYMATAKPAYWLFEGRQGEHLSLRAAEEAVTRYIRQVRPVGFRLHDCRHTYTTTFLRASGGDVWLCSKQLGHVSTKQIMERYGHVLTRDAERAAEYMAKALQQREDGRPRKAAAA